jgi:hypothetical protein
MIDPIGQTDGGIAAMANISSTSQPHEMILKEEEIFDVSLATFYVFDKENAGTTLPTRPLKKGPCTNCGSSIG